MMNKEEAIRMIVGETPPAEWSDKMTKIRLAFGWKEGEPLFDIFMLLDIENRMLSEKLKQAPLDIEFGLDKIRKAREAEMSLLEKRIDTAATEAKVKMVEEATPQISGRVADAVSGQIEKMSRTIGLERAMLLIGLAFFSLLITFMCGLFVGKALVSVDIFFDYANAMGKTLTAHELKVFVERLFYDYVAIAFHVTMIFGAAIIASYFSMRYENSARNFMGKACNWTVYLCLAFMVVSLYFAYRRFVMV